MGVSAAGRYYALQKSFRKATEGIYGVCSGQVVKDAFPSFTDEQRERLYQMLIKEMRYMHDNIVEEFNEVCQQEQVSAALVKIDEFVEQHNMDQLSPADKTSIDTINVKISTMKKQKIEYLADSLTKDWAAAWQLWSRDTPGHSYLFRGCASVDPKSNVVSIKSSKERMELKERKDLFFKRKKTKFSVPFVQQQQKVGVPDMQNKVPDVLFHEVPAAKDPMNKLTDSAVRNTGDANSCASKGHASGTSFTGSTSKELAMTRLAKICNASGWKEPLYDFEEQGPPHNKLFKCKVTVFMEGPTDTVLECFGDPKSQEKAAQEHAAEGALWCLQKGKRRGKAKLQS